ILSIVDVSPVFIGGSCDHGIDAVFSLGAGPRLNGYFGFAHGVRIIAEGDVEDSHHLQLGTTPDPEETLPHLITLPASDGLRHAAKYAERSGVPMIVPCCLPVATPGILVHNRSFGRPL